MTFKILTAIVFLAEVIITYTLIRKLIIFDNEILQASETVLSLKPRLKDVGYLIKQISAQCVEFSEEFVSKIIEKRNDAIFNNFNKIIIAVILLKLNSKTIKKIIRSKHFKRLSKGLSLFKYMV